MKGIKMIFLVIVMGLCALSSCKKENNNDDNNNDNDKQQTTNPTNVDEVEAWLKDQIDLILIDDDIYPLPTKYQDTNVTITWESSNKTVINNEGKIIKRNSKQISNVDLTYTITNENNDTKTGVLTIQVYPRTFEYMQTRVESQFPKQVYESLDYINLDISSAFKVTWTSSDQSVLNDDGTYIRPQVDTVITINYRIEATEEIYREYSFQVTVVCATDEEKIKMIRSWVENENIPDLIIKNNIKLPTTHPDYGSNIVWTTSDETVIALDGTVNQYIFDRYVELICKITLGNRTYEKAYWFTVTAKDISEMTELEIIEEFISIIAVKNLSKLSFTEYPNINQSYNALNFFDNEWEEQIEHIAPIASNRPGTKMSQVLFVLVHDTANNKKDANGLAHANYVENGGGGTSFHYVVGNDGIYHLIPNDEVAYHAGDGTKQKFEYLDSGVKATVNQPHIAIDADGYFTFNGVKSNLEIPQGASVTSSITPSGLHCMIGFNGNYFLAKNYYNTDYNYISNYGGNNNSIGIETCVDQGSNYLKTLRYNADLIARLLIENKLDVKDVIQHNHTAGKYCPAAIKTANYWQNFRDLVSLEKFGMEHFKSLTFEWFSSSSILSNDGYIDLLLNDETSVKYSVVVKSGDLALYTKEFETFLITK